MSDENNKFGGRGNPGIDHAKREKTRKPLGKKKPPKRKNKK